MYCVVTGRKREEGDGIFGGVLALGTGLEPHFLQSAGLTTRLKAQYVYFHWCIGTICAGYTRVREELLMVRIT